MIRGRLTLPRRWLQAPAAHFVALGALAFVLTRPPAEPAQPTAANKGIVVDAASLGGRSLEDFVEEEVLVREALVLGLDRDERAVRARLTNVGRFLDLTDSDDAARIEAEARAIDLPRRDPVVRRHLATLMRAYLSRLPPAEFPTEADLEGYLAAHSGELSAPARVRFSHVFLSRDRRGASLRAEATRLRARLVAAGAPENVAAGIGDPFVYGASEIVASPAEIDGIFGSGFATSMAALAPRAWSQPIASAYGLHLVWVHERSPGRRLSLAEARNRVLHRLLAERRAARLAERVAALRAGYRVRSAAGDE